MSEWYYTDAEIVSYIRNMYMTDYACVIGEDVYVHEPDFGPPTDCRTWYVAGSVESVVRSMFFSGAPARNRGEIGTAARRHRIRAIAREYF